MRVGRRRVRCGRARGGQEVRLFEPAEIDNKPAPVKMTYKYDFVFKEEAVGPIINFEGLIRDRATKKPIEGLKVTRRRASGEPITDDEGTFSSKRCPMGKHTRHHHRGLASRRSRTEETVEEGQAPRGEVHRHAERREARRGVGLRRNRDRGAADQERSPLAPRSRSRKGGASPGRKATRSKSCKTCRAWRAPPSARGSSWCGARHRKTRASTWTASGCRSSITAVGFARRSTPTWCARSTWRPVDTARSTVAGSVDW